MTTVTEGRQELTFDASWRALKWDESQEFKGSMEATFAGLSERSVKAADVVGVRRGRGITPVALIAEFKDFDHPKIPAAQRAAAAQRGVSDEVMRDVIAKVVDSLCGAAFAHDTAGRRAQQLDGWRTALGLKTTSVLVLVCAELPITQAVAGVAWTAALKKRLRWLGPDAHIVVTSSSRPFRGEGLAYGLTAPGS